MMRAEKRIKTLRFISWNPAGDSFLAEPRSRGPENSCRGPVRMGEERFRKTFQRRRGRALRTSLPGRADDPGVEAALHLQHRLNHAPGHPRRGHRLARIVLGQLDILQPRLPERL